MNRLIYCVPIAALTALCILYFFVNVEFRRQVAACHREGGIWDGEWGGACLLPGQVQ